MPCYHPIPAYQSGPGASVMLHAPHGVAHMMVPCGSCLGCRLQRATHWAHRCMHEAQYFDHNAFVTLTYDDSHVPPDGNLSPKALQLFIKRVRKDADSPCGVLDCPGGGGVRFFACGEYGERTGRPHYHVLFFNLRFRDAVRVGNNLYESAALARLWPYGGHRIGTVTARSAMYCAKYSCKSMGPACDSDGVVRVKPFARMSRNPGLGTRWLRENRLSLRNGFIVVDGKERGIPRAYRKLLRKEDGVLCDSVEYNQYSRSVRYGMAEKSAPERLAAAEVIHRQRVGEVIPTL